MKLISTITLFLTLPWFCFAGDLVTLIEKQSVVNSQGVLPGSKLEWRLYQEDPTVWHLFDGSQQVGALYSDGLYRARIGDGWGVKQEPPQSLVLPNRLQNFGVEFQKIHEDNRVTVNGQEVPITRLLPTRSTQQQGQQLLDDSHFSFVTFICGDEQARNRIQKQWESDPRFAKDRKEMHFNALPLKTPKGDHHTSRLFRTEQDERFQKAGGAFFIQGPAGDDGKSKPVAIYSQNIDDLAKWLPAARREVDPNYQPNKVPDITQPKLLPFDLTPLYQFWTKYKTYILVGAIIVIVWWRNK